MYQELHAPLGTTDLIFLTDARARVPTDVRERFTAWKQSVRGRVVTLVVGNQPGDLALVSDECHSVNALDPDGDAVGRVLSL